MPPHASKPSMYHSSLSLKVRFLRWAAWACPSVPPQHPLSTDHPWFFSVPVPPDLSSGGLHVLYFFYLELSIVQITFFRTQFKHHFLEKTSLISSTRSDPTNVSFLSTPNLFDAVPVIIAVLHVFPYLFDWWFSVPLDCGLYLGGDRVFWSLLNCVLGYTMHRTNMDWMKEFLHLGPWTLWIYICMYIVLHIYNNRISQNWFNWGNLVNTI